MSYRIKHKEQNKDTILTLEFPTNCGFILGQTHQSQK